MLPGLPNYHYGEKPQPSSEPPRATHQRGFVLGVIAPAICVALNLPSVCGGNTFSLYGSAEPFRPLFLVFGLLGCIAMTIGIFSERLSIRMVGRLAGMLFTAGLACMLALFLLLPNFFFLMIFPPFVGILGLVPMISVALWARNGYALLYLVPREQERVSQRGVVEGVIGTIAIALATQLLATLLVTLATNTLTQGNLAQAPVAQHALRLAFWCSETCTNPVKEAYYSTENPVRKQILQEVYKQRVGREIDAYPGGCY